MLSSSARNRLLYPPSTGRGQIAFPQFLTSEKVTRIGILALSHIDLDLNKNDRKTIFPWLVLGGRM